MFTVAAEERANGTRSPRVSANGGYGSPTVGSPPGQGGFRVGSPPSSVRPSAPRGYEALEEDDESIGRNTNNRNDERVYSDGNPYGAQGGGHTSNPSPSSHHTPMPRPDVQPPSVDASSLGDVTSPDAVKKLHEGESLFLFPYAQLE